MTAETDQTKEIEYLRKERMKKYLEAIDSHLSKSIIFKSYPENVGLVRLEDFNEAQRLLGLLMVTSK